jgi:hypothetical protein
MFQLITNAQYKLAIVSLKSYHSKKLIVESFNTCSLTLHFEDVFANPNLLTSHILCLHERRTRNIHLNSKIYNVLHKSSIYCHVMMNMALWYFMMTMCH